MYYYKQPEYAQLRFSQSFKYSSRNAQTIDLYGQLSKYFQRKIAIFSYPSCLAYVLGAQKNRLIETVLLSTHNICFG